MDVLRLGVPKGSLEAATIELFRRSGWKINADARSYFPTVDDPSLQMHSAAELKTELEQGIERSWKDLNPLKLFRERK